MRISFRRSFLAQLLSVILACSSASWGWGNAGHEAVAYVAWQQLTPETRTRVMALLMQVPTLQSPEHKTIPGYNDWVKDLPAGLSDDEKNLYLFMRAATWPDTIKHVGFEDSDNPPKGVTQDVNIGFSDTKSHGYWHFVDAGFASDNSTVPPTPMPNAETQIAAFRTAISSGESGDLKAYDLVWLEHMVGDIHQPLHGTARYFQNKSDEGGNLVVIKLTPAMKKKFEGTVSKSAPQELHAFWDDLPGEGTPVTALPGAATFGKGLANAPADKVADTDPSDWAAESLTIAEADAYASPIGKSPQPAGSTSKSAGYLITVAYYNQAMQDAQDRVALAGARLAKLLNENLK